MRVKSCQYVKTVVYLPLKRDGSFVNQSVVYGRPTRDQAKTVIDLYRSQGCPTLESGVLTGGEDYD